MSAKVIVLLGAGASVPFGIPDTRKLAEDVEQNLQPYSSRIREIRDNVRNFGFTDDIEAVLSVLDFWSNPMRTIHETGPFFAETTNLDPSHFRKKRRDARIALRIKEYIVRICFVNDPDVIERIEQLYGQFFQDISQEFNLPDCDPQGRLVCPAMDVFTTNYDNVIEEYCRRSGVNLYDGYRELFRGNFVFDQDYYEKGLTSLRLYKLHGTVTYAHLKTGGIDRVSFIPRRGRLVIGGQEAYPDLIYPGMHRYLAREPQLELLNLLKKRLLSAGTCIVIGYSFGDPNIRQVFTDVSNRNNTLKIYLVSPRANRIINEERLNSSQFVPVDKKFEDLSVEDDLR